jgi:hypothetical protein
MVSAIIARMAPAATASTAATQAGDTPAKARLPSGAATAEASAIPPQTPKM